MKQKFYTFLLTALLGMFGMNAWAEDYEISTAQDLVDFATAVNGGEFEANAVLTADIDMSGITNWVAIGDWGAKSGTSSACYKGHFDGQGHKITGFTATASHNYYGIFGVISSCLIENFSVYGTISTGVATAGGVAGYARDANTTIRNVHSYVIINNTANGKRVGGILGTSHNGTIFVDRCTYSGTLDGKDSADNGNYGGIVGYVYNGTGANLQVTNCLFDGKLINTAGTPGNCTFGGIIGYAGASPTVAVSNCLSIGTLTSNVVGQFYGGVKGNNCSLADSYYKSGSACGAISNSPSLSSSTVTDAQLASGEVAFLLNGSVSGGTNWFQTLVPAFELGAQQTYSNVQYVGTINGDDNNPKTQTTDITIVNNGDNTINIVLKNFSVTINGVEANVDEISLDNVATSVGEDGLTHFDEDDGHFTIPTSDLPPLYQTLVAQGLVSFTDIPFTLHGKLNETQIFSEIDIFISSALGNKNVHIVVGADDFPTADAYPTPNGTAKVYVNGRQHCDGTAYEGTSFSNQDLGMTQDSHNYVDGFCDYCGVLDETYMTPNADGFFEIANEKQLVWFAAYVNQVSVAAKGKLMNNIALTKAWTTPIGTGTGNVTPGASTYTGIAYTGTFDGQEYAITGFNAEGTGHLGLFGDANGATIKNFSISGNLTVTSGYGGGVVAWPVNSTIENVHSALVISVPNSGTHHIGGIVGSARGGNTIDRCSFTGSLTVAAGSTDNFGGIAAYITDGDNVIDCYNSGNITFSAANCAAGGIIGYLNSTSAYVQNCLTIGNIIFDGEGTPNYGAAILGRTKNTNFEKITNNYWLEGSAYAAAKNSDGSSDPLATGSVTIDQLVSGEVAYLLGEAWGQLIGTDEVPVLGGDTPVFYVGPAGYATLFDNNNDWALNGDAQAYIGTANGQYIHLTAIDDIPMCTAVIIKGTYYNKLTTTATSDVSANELLGTEEDTPADGTMYVLAKPEGMEIGFYLAEINTTIPAGKAYYQSTSGVKGFIFADDDATGIEMVNGQSSMVNGSIFNLAGQRLSKMQKGINIVGSKKVLY